MVLEVRKYKTKFWLLVGALLEDGCHLTVPHVYLTVSLPLLERSLISSWGPSLMTSLPPEGPTSKYHHIGSRLSTCEFEGHKNI